MLYFSIQQGLIQVQYLLNFSRYFYLGTNVTDLKVCKQRIAGLLGVLCGVGKPSLNFVWIPKDSALSYNEIVDHLVRVVVPIGEIKFHAREVVNRLKENN